MKVGMARAALLAVAAVMAIASCGKGSGAATTTGAGGGDAGPSGPTTLAVTWTLAGAPASASTCTAHGATQIALTLSGTIDPSEHQSTTVDCAKGSTKFDDLLVQNLGTPYLEGALLDAMGTSVAIVGVDVTPVLGTTDATLAFFAPQGTGGAGGASSSSTAASTAAASTSASSGGGSTAASSSAASSTAASSSAAASSSSSSSTGGVDAG
jgi:hypothetical protein